MLLYLGLQHPSPPFLFRVKKKEPQKEDKPAGQATKNRPPSPT